MRFKSVVLLSFDQFPKINKPGFDRMFTDCEKTTRQKVVIEQM
jgi:hypothetical protein